MTITGTNDQTVLTAIAAQPVNEATDALAQDLLLTGTLSFSDKDVGDTLAAATVGTPTVVESTGVVLPTGLAAALAPALSFGTAVTSDGTTQTIGYTYDPAAVNLDFLRAGQTITVTYAVKVGDSATQNLVVTITGTNDAPVINSNGGGATASVSVAENSTAVTTVTATDVDSPTITYSIVGGLDAAKFTINSTTRALSFIAAPNFEAPTDNGSNNVYDVMVRASDGSLFDDQAIAVTVTNVNEAPTDIILAAQQPSSGTVLPGVNGTIATLSTVDLDAGDSFTYRFNNSGIIVSTLTTNGATFSLSGSTLSTTTGLAENKTYILTIRSTDGGGLFREEVVNIVTGTNANAGDPNLSGANGDDILYGLGSNGGNQDILIGGTGNDTLYGGDGNDVYKFGLADGNDIIGDTVGNNDQIQIITSSPTDSTGLSILNFERIGNDLVIIVNSTQITVKNQYAFGGGEALETIQFTNGGTINGYKLSTTSYALNLDTANPLDGTSNEDVIAGTSSATGETINGANKNDLLFGNAGDDTLNGGSGNDLLIGGAGNDILNGGAGDDNIDGGDGTDLISFADVGGGFLFTLGAGGSGAAIVNGTDTYSNIEGVIGGNGNDTLTGNSSDNILRGGAGNDTINGAGGVDLLDLSDGMAGINFTLTNSAANTIVNLSTIGLSTAPDFDTYSNIEGVIGTFFADTLTGSVSADELRGGGGNDTLFGLG